MTDTHYTSKTILGKEVLFRKFDGLLSIEEEINMLQYAVDNGLINENVSGMILDMTAAQFDFGVGEGHKIVDYVSTVESLAKLKYAIIVDTPEKIIYPLLGELHSEEALLKPFSTEEAAIHWVIT